MGCHGWLVHFVYNANIYNSSIFLSWNLRNYLWASCQTNMFPKHYSKTPVTRLTLKRNKKQFEWERNLSYCSKFQWNFDQGKGNIVRVSGEFEWPEFKLSRANCISAPKEGANWDQTEAQRAEKFFLETGPPLISRCGSSTANWHHVTKDPKYPTALRTWLKRGTVLSLQVNETMKGRDFTSWSI